MHVSKIWILLGRLSLMRNVQLMKKKIYIFRVYHTRIIATKKMVHTTGNRQIPQKSLSGMCACLPQHPWLFIFSSRGHDRQSSEQNDRKLISYHNNGEDDKHAHGFADFFSLVVGDIFRLETCMNSLVKGSLYSKLNFQEKKFFTQNWCNITSTTSTKYTNLTNFHAKEHMNSWLIYSVSCFRDLKPHEQNKYLVF